MPREKCPRCGAPFDAASVRVECDYCGWKGRTRLELIAGDLWKLTQEALFLVLIAAAMVPWRQWRRHFIEIGPPVLAALIGVIFRFLPARELKSQFVDLMPCESSANTPPIRQFPHEPLFPTPRSWTALLSSARPRRLRLSNLAGSEFLTWFIVLLFGATFVLCHWSSFQGRRTPGASLFLAGFILVVIYGIGRCVNVALEAKELMRSGEVTVGWVTDFWETGGGRSKQRKITIEFRDAAGRLFEHDFPYRGSENSCDPGHPILVFYAPLCPERCIVECATIFTVAEPEESFSATRAG